MIVVIALIISAVVLIGILYPGSGADRLDWRPTRSAELEYTNEIDDLAQMEAAVNAKRRARGAAAISHVELKAEIEREMADIREDAELEEEDLRQLLEARNSRRRARGQAEQTLEEFERSLLGGPDGAT